MDAGYAVLIFLVAFIATMVVWGLTGISPIGFLRLALGSGGESVKSLTDAAPDVMSRARESAPPSAPSSLETDGRTDGRTAPGARFTEDQLLTLYGLMRAHGIARDKAGPALRGVGLPMNNNLWTRAAAPLPPAPIEDDDEVLTPIAGRRTKASFYPEDPELDFQPPPR